MALRPAWWDERHKFMWGGPRDGDIWFRYREQDLVRIPSVGDCWEHVYLFCVHHDLFEYKGEWPTREETVDTRLGG